MSCNFGLQAVRRRAQTYVHIDLMADRTHSSSSHSQRFEWNLLATSEHRYGEPETLGSSKIGCKTKMATNEMEAK